VNNHSPESPANLRTHLQANHGQPQIRNGYANSITKVNARNLTTTVHLSTIQHATSSKQGTASAEQTVCSLTGIPRQEHSSSQSLRSSSRGHKEVTPPLQLPSRQRRRRTTARTRSPLHRDAGGVPAMMGCVSDSLPLMPARALLPLLAATETSWATHARGHPAARTFSSLARAPWPLSLLPAL